MIIHEAKVVKRWIPVGQYITKAGDVRDNLVPVVLGIRMRIDNVTVFYSTKHGTFSVEYPQRTVRNKALQAVDVVKGEKFGGMLPSKFTREYGRPFVEKVKEAMKIAIADANG